MAKVTGKIGTTMDEEIKKVMWVAPYRPRGNGRKCTNMLQLLQLPPVL
jgi:hypothetical protein